MKPELSGESADRRLGIGNTPIAAVSACVEGTVRRIFLKLEGLNPCGSSKDRTALSLVDDAEAKRMLSPSTIVIESTSGNLGVALAFVCARKGYRFVAVVDPKITSENLRRLEKLGADIDLVRQADATGGYLAARIKRVQELCASSNRYVCLNQYANPANPLAHYKTTGPEIYRQMGGNASAVFIAVSTGGTLAGISRHFREISPRTTIVAVDAVGSTALGGQLGSRRLTGIGSSQPSAFVDRSHYDLVIRVSDRDAFAYCHSIGSTAGTTLGGSSGAVLAACVEFLKTHPESRRPVCVCPDGGASYQSTIYSHAWLEQSGVTFPAGVATFARVE